MKCKLLFVLPLCSALAFAALPEKKQLPTQLLGKTELIIEDVNKPNILSIDNFTAPKSYSLEVKASVEVAPRSRGLDIHAIDQKGKGFRFSINSEELWHVTSSTLYYNSLKQYIDNKETATFRFAKKNDSIFVYHNGVYLGGYLDLVSNLVYNGDFLMKCKNLDTKNYSFELNPAMWKTDAKYFNDPNRGIRLVKHGEFIPVSLNKEQKGIYFDFLNTDEPASYLSTPVTIEPNKTYVLQFDLITWGSVNGLNKKIGTFLSTAANGTGSVSKITTSTTTSVSAQSSRVKVEYTGEELAKLGNNLYVVFKKVDKGQFGITNILFQQKESFVPQLTVGKSYSGGVPARFKIESITYDASGAFAPELKEPEGETWLPTPENPYVVKSRSDIALVESSFPVGFAQCIAGGKHFIGYYDQNKNMVIAERLLTSKKWSHTILPTKIGWDSHNYITMIVDNEGYIHVSGNMHNVYIKYFRSKKPYDASAFDVINYMTGKEENQATYPLFLKMANGDILYHYRQGASGSGYEVYNKWNPDTKTWTRFLDKPMIDGKGLRNAYMSGPTLGPDGYYHLIWVWRESADCATNNTFSYARSLDLKNWENVDGQPVASPLTIEEKSLVIDPSPVRTGILNGVQRIAFDSNNKPVFACMKYDNFGNSQFFLYKRVNGAWKERMITKWPYRYNFSGIGSIQFGINMGEMKNCGNGQMSIIYNHIEFGSAEIVFDEETLQPIGKRKFIPKYPAELNEITSIFSKPMYPQIRIIENYILRWEALGANNDQKPADPLPKPYMMELIEIEKSVLGNDIISSDETDCFITAYDHVISISKLGKNQKISVFDISGRLIFNQNSNHQTLTIPIENKGIYLVQVDHVSAKVAIN